MREYLTLLSTIMSVGTDKKDRTGVGTRSLFGYQLRLDLAQGFPLLTTKQLPVKSVVYDLLWMIRGETNVRFLNDHGVRIWNPWADEFGEVGPVYGRQWRAWPDGSGGTIDQLQEIISLMRSDPNSRRLVVSAWNVADLDKMAVPPCPTLFQFNVTNGKLSCHLYQRSADAFIGLPFNIAQFALLTCMAAHVTGLEPSHFIHSFGDVHLYQPHIPLAERQLSREPRPLPELRLNPAVKEVTDFAFDDIEIRNYQPHPRIKADVVI
jgi:thymidylate synthase